MPSLVTIKVSYQHVEEVLATTGLYEVDGGLTTLTAGNAICEEACAILVPRATALLGIMGTRDRLISIEATIPGGGDNPGGPYGYHRAIQAAGTDAQRDTKVTDMVAAQLVWQGTNELDEPVRNAKYWSMLSPTDCDCMELLEAAISEIQIAWNTFFTAQLSISTATLNRTVANTRASVPGLVTYHPCDAIVVSPTLASIRTRRGDITPRRGKITAAPIVP